MQQMTDTKMEGPSVRRLAFAITAYCVTSLAVVYFNWWLFTSGFKYPVFISWLQQVIGFGIFLGGSTVALYFQRIRPVFPPPVFHKSVLAQVAPLSASFCLTIAASNLCLQKVQISTYQVARSLTLLFVLLLSYIILKQSQTPLVLAACVLMVAGFVINSLDPGTLSLYGVLFGALSSFFQALYNVLIKFTLPAVENNNQMLLFYNVLLSSFLFVPVVFVSEGMEPFWQSINAAEHSMFVVWGGILVSGLLGTSLNMSQYLLINCTTPLSFNIVGLIKAIVQSLGGIIFLGDKVSAESLLGIGLSTVGSAIYVKAKHDQAGVTARDSENDVADSVVVLETEEDAMKSNRVVASAVTPDIIVKETTEDLATPSTVFDVKV
ncbi:putative GDP-fucose transporter [Gregarina niphandrodes]|uniref:GDP-fucose transporter n=1 Tax=Gregarina niphandrodes TaxID=110365 RepID=A0A023B9L7_GRENI|nr:putative GDP-fucose transporter [Gregarina niphandrodes]EZG73003.1 putative GDP-fucose transporter [Gregarina niphandrodes]|eukprot:XP_011129698.1 putative GDP-fucose transporter [Gregarina niphandrodes]